QADEQHGHREETLVDTAQVLPADEQPPEVAQPGEAALDFVALAILCSPGQHGASALGSPAGRSSLGRDTHADATTPHGTAERATIIPAIRHQLLGSPSGAASRARDPDRVQGALGEPDLGCGGAVQVEAERKTIPVDDEHPLGALPLLGEADLV